MSCTRLLGISSDINEPFFVGWFSKLLYAIDKSYGLCKGDDGD